MTEITGLAHVELSVSDLERSVRWYCEFYFLGRRSGTATPATAL